VGAGADVGGEADVVVVVEVVVLVDVVDVVDEVVDVVDEVVGTDVEPLGAGVVVCGPLACDDVQAAIVSAAMTPRTSRPTAGDGRRGQVRSEGCPSVSRRPSDERGTCRRSTVVRAATGTRCRGR
jgi:hypothetical protein